MSESEISLKRSWLWRGVFLLIGLGLLWIVFAGIDVFVVWQNARVIGWGLLGVVILYVLAFLIDSLSWHLTLVSLPISFRWVWRLFAVRMVGETYNNVTPIVSMGGEPVKAILLKRHYAVPYHESTASLILAKTINMVGLCVFLMIGFSFMIHTGKFELVYKQTAGIGLTAIVVATVLFFSIQRLRLGSILGEWVSNRFLSKRIHFFVQKIQSMDEALVKFYTTNGRRLFVASMLAFLNWVLGVVEIYIVFWILDRPITWSEAWIIEAVTQMVRSSTFFIPLSIGAQEGAFLIVAGTITGAPALGLSIGLVRRFRELIWIIFGYLIGVCYTASFGRFNPRSDIN
ncbi:MAG: hypothetical protein CMF69_04010 [Magnetovibrio sp.]|nr:hypothetical protein [Magnetovibrio sp.]